MMLIVITTNENGSLQRAGSLDQSVGDRTDYAKESILESAVNQAKKWLKLISGTHMINCAPVASTRKVALDSCYIRRG